MKLALKELALDRDGPSRSTSTRPDHHFTRAPAALSTRGPEFRTRLATDRCWRYWRAMPDVASGGHARDVGRRVVRATSLHVGVSR